MNITNNQGQFKGAMRPLIPDPLDMTDAQTEDAAVQLHADFTEIVREEIGMNERFASALAHAIVTGLRKRYGGQRLGSHNGVYVPAPGKQERNRSIRKRFNGKNWRELCDEFGITRRRLYQIVGEKEAQV